MGINFKELKCNLCGSESYKLLVTCKIEQEDSTLLIDRMNLVRCSNCSLVYVNPRPEYSMKDMAEMYSENYFNAPYMRFYIEKDGEQSNESFDLRLDWIESYIKNGKILDIGCASGGFLKIARSRGWETYGVEISEEASNIAREKHKLNVITGKLSDTCFDNEFFDVVTAGDVLEHVEDPKSFLFEINRILKKGGMVYIAVPDFDGLIFKVSVLIALFNHRNYFTLPLHIYNFSKKTISRYLWKTKFNIIGYKKTEANISTKGFRGKIEWIIFFIARLINKQDRILFLAKKEE